MSTLLATLFLNKVNLTQALEMVIANIYIIFTLSHALFNVTEVNAAFMQQTVLHLTVIAKTNQWALSSHSGLNQPKPKCRASKEWQQNGEQESHQPGQEQDLLLLVEAMCAAHPAYVTARTKVIFLKILSPNCQTGGFLKIL